MSVLLIDIGNSRCKWLQVTQRQFGDMRALAHQSPDFAAQLQLAWRDLSPPQTLAIASVANPDITTTVLSLARQLWPGLRVVQPQAEANAHGVRNAYAAANKLGLDRWLALIAAHHYYPGPCCIVDCGTALTLDSIDAAGQHLGGLISPGWRLMSSALASKTAALQISAAPDALQALLANDTATALYNGALYAMLGLIESVLQRLPETGQLILTGGDAELIAKHINIPLILDQQLVFKGLYLYC